MLAWCILLSKSVSLCNTQRRAQLSSVSKKRQGLSTKTERESQEVAEEIKYRRIFVYLYSMSKIHSEPPVPSQKPIIPPHLHGKLPNPTFDLQNKTSTNPSRVRGISVARTEAYTHYNKSYSKMESTCAAPNNASSHDSPYTPWTHIQPFRLCDR